MAANLKSVQGIASLWKQSFNKIWTTRQPTPSSTTRFASAFTSRRSAHGSVYDKNLDDQVRPTVVPDDVIQPESEKYWAPHPQTGVFGPAAEHNPIEGGFQTSPAEGGFQTSPAEGGEESVLEEKAWFRPTSLEDLEKSHHN